MRSATQGAVAHGSGSNRWQHGLIALGAGPSAAGAYMLTLGLATVVMVFMVERRRPFEMIVLCAAA